MHRTFFWKTQKQFQETQRVPFKLVKNRTSLLQLETETVLIHWKNQNLKHFFLEKRRKLQKGDTLGFFNIL